MNADCVSLDSSREEVGSVVLEDIRGRPGRPNAHATPEDQALHPTRPARVGAVPRLIERLNAGLHRRLTLISAPAGFGRNHAAD
jgi:hypothetical protein